MEESDDVALGVSVIPIGSARFQLSRRWKGFSDTHLGAVSPSLNGL